MTVKLKTSKHLDVKKDTVVFTLDFYKKCKEFTDAFDKVYLDMNTAVDGLKEKGIPADSISTVPVNTAIVWKYQEEKKENGIIKTPVRDGYSAVGSVLIELPLTWADDEHKFSDIYAVTQGLKTIKGIRYEYLYKDLAFKAGELRSMLLEEARVQATQLLDGYNANNLKLKHIWYGVDSDTSVSRSSYMYEEACFGSASSKCEEEIKYSAEMIDRLVSTALAPTIKLQDNVTTEWELSKK